LPHVQRRATELVNGEVEEKLMRHLVPTHSLVTAAVAVGAAGVAADDAAAAAAAVAASVAEVGEVWQ